MDLIEKLVKDDDSIKGIWCVPKYSNPTGVTYSDETVRRFAALKPAAKDFKIMWDNAYCVHDLTDTPDTLLNIYDLCVENGTEDQIFIFASTSKISFPGAGVAGLATSDNNIRDFKEHTLTSTIGPDKLNQLRHVLFLHDINGVRALMKGHRAILEPKFRLCELMLEENVGDLGVAEWNKPNGGYFISVNLMDGCAKEVHRLLKEAGVTMTAAFFRKQGTGLFARCPGSAWVGEREKYPLGLRGIREPDPIRLEDMVLYERERGALVENTRRLLDGRQACNILLYGDKGTGKSATVKALLSSFWLEGLRIVEVPLAQLTHLPTIFSILREIREQNP